MSKPGFVGGRHYTTYVEEFKRLKREGELEKAEALLLRLVKATEDEARTEGWDPAPGYYEHLAIVYRKQKRLAQEIAILERYERFTGRPTKRLTKLRGKDRS